MSESPLVNKLLADKKYIEGFDDDETISSSHHEHQYKKMQYAVKKYGKVIHSLGKSIYEQCAEYALEHSKSPTVSEPELYIAKRLYAIHRMDADLLSEAEYSHLVDSVNKALRYSAVNWTDWQDMLVILKLYMLRAEVAFDRGHQETAMADLRHATSVLKYYSGDPEDMFAYFEKNVTEGQQLLLSMLTLQEKLMSKFVNSKMMNMVVMVMGINGRADVCQAIESIRVNDNLYEYAMDKLTPKTVNVEMTEKAMLAVDADAGGRCWKARAVIGEGETVLSERPQVVVLFEEQCLAYCDYCHRKMSPPSTFWPCEGCTQFAYCSAVCGQSAYLEYHHAECAIYGFIMNECNYNATLAYRHYAIFGRTMASQCEQELSQEGHSANANRLRDFLASEAALSTKAYSALPMNEKKTLCAALTTQLSHRGEHLPVNEIYQTVRAITLIECLFYKGLIGKDIFKNEKEYSQLVEDMAMMIMRTVTNSFSWDQAEEGEEEKVHVGCATSLQASMFNHSCDPNVAWTITDGLLTMEALREISSGEELSISYGPRAQSPLYSRQVRLRRDYIFFCRCQLCRFDAFCSPETLACQSPACPGPLVLSTYRSCLLCSYQPSEARTTRLADTGAHASAQLMRLFEKAYQPHGSQWKVSAILSAQSTRILTAIGIYKKTTSPEKQMNSSEEDCIRPLSKQQIVQLETQFDICSKVFYGGSLHMLEKCIMLLKVSSKISNKGSRK